MKKIGLLLIGILLFAVGCTNSIGYEEIYYKDFMKKIENKENFVLVIGKQGCGYCEDYKTNLKKVYDQTKYQVNYIDISRFNDKETTEFGKLINITGTPTTIFFKNGQETTTYDRLVGAVSADKLIEKLTKLGFIE